MMLFRRDHHHLLHQRLSLFVTGAVAVMFGGAPFLYDRLGWLWLGLKEPLDYVRRKSGCAIRRYHHGQRRRWPTGTASTTRCRHLPAACLLAGSAAPAWDGCSSAATITCHYHSGSPAMRKPLRIISVSCGRRYGAIFSLALDNRNDG